MVITEGTASAAHDTIEAEAPKKDAPRRSPVRKVVATVAVLTTVTGFGSATRVTTLCAAAGEIERSAIPENALADWRNLAREYARGAAPADELLRMEEITLLQTINWSSLNGGDGRKFQLR